MTRNPKFVYGNENPNYVGVVKASKSSPSQGNVENARSDFTHDSDETGGKNVSNVTKTEVDTSDFDNAGNMSIERYDYGEGSTLHVFRSESASTENLGLSDKELDDKGLITPHVRQGIADELERRMGVGDRPGSGVIISNKASSPEEYSIEYRDFDTSSDDADDFYLDSSSEDIEEIFSTFTNTQFSLAENSPEQYNDGDYLSPTDADSVYERINSGNEESNPVRDNSAAGAINRINGLGLPHKYMAQYIGYAQDRNS